MKKVLSVLIAVCMCCGLLAGCGNAGIPFESDLNRRDLDYGCYYELSNKWESVDFIYEDKNTEKLQRRYIYKIKDAVLEIVLWQNLWPVTSEDGADILAEQFGKIYKNFAVRSSENCNKYQAEAREQFVTMEYDGSKVDSRIVSFDTEDAVISFVLIQEEEKETIVDTFEKTLNSVCIDGAKKDSSDFQDGTYICEMNGITYSVPEKWKEQKGECENIYKSDEVELIVKDLPSTGNEVLINEFVDSYISKYGEHQVAYDVGTVYASGQERALFYFSYSDDCYYNGRCAAFKYQNGFVIFSLVTKYDSEKNYESDLRDIIESCNLEGEKEDEKELTGNILFDTKFEICPVKSGTGDVIGTYLEYQISKSDLKNITQEQFADFMNERVLETMKGLVNYATVDFRDGTGLVFMPGVAVATYGELDNTGSVVKQIGIVMLEEDGTYSYSETE